MTLKDNLKYWVGLNLVLAENLQSIKKVLQAYPVVEEVFKANYRDFIALGLKEEEARALTSPQILDKAQREIDHLEKKRYTVLTIEGEDYPEYLREVFDPPIVLYCAGDVKALSGPAVSIVGARKPTAYGRAVTERIARDLSSRGMVVVSGMARGIDSIAHWGALQEGKTVAVQGSGLENIYPKENKRLFEKIIEKGAVVTEYSRKSPPLGFHFPLRNRIISGLSLAVVVVEATRKSGSLITARLALEQNREVMAVPGNVTSKLSQGTNWLIKTGARLVESWEDVAEELPMPYRDELLKQSEQTPENLSSLGPEEKQIYELLSPDSLMHVDTLVDNSTFSVSEILSYLLHLELKGFVIPSPGKYYQRKW